MKILWFIENLSLGGQQTQSINLIKRIREAKKFEIDVLYFNDGPLHGQFKDACSSLTHLTDLKKGGYKNPLNIIKAIRKYYKYLCKNKYDVVLSNGIISFGLSSIMKLIFSFKHVRLLGGPLKDIEPTYEKYLHNILPFHKNLDIAFGWPGKNVVERKRYGKKLILFNHAVDTKMFFIKDKEVKENIRKKYLIKDYEIVIGWVGRIASNMEIKNTIKLGGELKKRNICNFKILIVGGGSWEDGMFDLIEREGIKDHCIYLGWQPMELIPNLFQAMDIVPLLDDDPVGGSIIREAMACGSLIVSVDGISKAQSEWIINNHNGLLVSDTNYIQETANIVEDYILNEKSKYNLMCVNGARYAKIEMSFIKQAEIIVKGMLND
ncbi:glycosyltransferase family 4 protein [Corallibacter sp.]|uniref:glycosyltransferase family 4 protein n=1 Tax=Corallibacter sp. TaxID=2038084 RepID=UPI003A8EEC99